MHLRGDFVIRFKNKLSKLHIRAKIMGIYLSIFMPIMIIVVLLITNLSNNYAKDVVVTNNQLVLKNTAEQIDNVVRDMDRISLLTISDTHLQSILINYKNSYSYQHYLNNEWMENFFLSLITIRESICSIRIVKSNFLIYAYNAGNNNFKYNFNYNRENWVKLSKRSKGGTVILGTGPVNDIDINSKKDKNSSYAISVARQINKSLTAIPVGYIKIDTNLGVIKSIIDQYKNKDSDIVICDKKEK